MIDGKLGLGPSFTTRQIRGRVALITIRRAYRQHGRRLRGKVGFSVSTSNQWKPTLAAPRGVTDMGHDLLTGAGHLKPEQPDKSLRCERRWTPVNTSGRLGQDVRTVSGCPES